MSTTVTLFINCPDHQILTEKVIEYLGGNVHTSKEPLEPIYRDTFINSNEPPNNFAIHTFTNQWTSINYNSWSKVEKLIEMISEYPLSKVICLQMQSVSSYIYLSVFINGMQVREIEYSGDSGLMNNNGIPFDFEDDEEFATDLETFGMDEIEDFCSLIGCDIRCMDDCTDSTYVLKKIDSTKHITSLIKKLLTFIVK